MGTARRTGSTRRRMPSAYDHRQKRGPNGEPLCRWCERPVQPPRRTYCSDECVHEWKLRSNPGYLRQQVYRRDKGVCAICGLDTKGALSKVLEAERRAREETPWDPQAAGNLREARRRRQSELQVEMGLRPEIPPDHRKTLWDADHIVPVVEGGGECDLSNIRTLCWWCHRDETAKLRRRLSGRPEQLRLMEG